MYDVLMCLMKLEVNGVGVDCDALKNKSWCRIVKLCNLYDVGKSEYPCHTSLNLSVGLEELLLVY